ncbi:MAG: LPD38 domain-containing protein [Sterolibacterium sp.]
MAESLFWDAFDKEQSSPATADMWAEFDKSQPGDMSSGFKRSFAQVPELAYGTAALAAMSAEKIFGEGGLSTTAKDYFASKYAEKQQANQQYAPTVEFTDAWDNLGADPGKMVDWIQDSAGYVVGQGLQTVLTGGIGALAGKMTLGTVVAGSAAKAADKMVAEEIAKRGLQGLAAKQFAEAALPTAVAEASKRLTTALGAGVVLTGQNLGMEAGDIYGGLTEEAKRTGKEITGADLARAWGSAGAAAATETLTDMLGLGALTGRIKIGGKAMQEMTGIGGRAARGATAAAVGMPLEGGQEYIQTGLEQFGAGRPMDTPEAAKERINAAAVGTLGGAIMGGGIGAVQGAQPAEVRPIPQSSPPQTLDQTIQTVTSQPTVVAATEEMDRQLERQFGTLSQGKTGFGQLDEFSTLLDQERENKEQRMGLIQGAQERTRQLQFDSGIESADARVTGAREAETRTARLSLLDTVYANPKEKTPAKTFLARLESEFPNNPSPTPEEKWLIANREHAYQAFHGTQDTVPSLPNEMDPNLVPERKTKGVNRPLAPWQEKLRAAMEQRRSAIPAQDAIDAEIASPAPGIQAVAPETPIVQSQENALVTPAEAVQNQVPEVQQAPQPAKAVPGVAVEPWKLTRDEFIAQGKRDSIYASGLDKIGLGIIGVPEEQQRPDYLNSATLVSPRSDSPWIAAVQRYKALGGGTYSDWARMAIIEKAIADGKRVPDSVLSDYPKLKEEVANVPPQEIPNAGISAESPAAQRAPITNPTVKDSLTVAAPVSGDAVAGKVNIKSAKTGQPFQARLMRGQGREDSPYNPLVPQEGILGSGRYTTGDMEFAKYFGANITEHDVNLSNPLVIDNDVQWRALTKRAGWEFPNPISITGDTTKASVDIARLRKIIVGDGHDGVIVKVPERESEGKTMQNVFGADQVIEFNPSTPQPNPEQSSNQPVAEINLGENIPPNEVGTQVAQVGTFTKREKGGYNVTGYSEEVMRAAVDKVGIKGAYIGKNGSTVLPKSANIDALKDALGVPLPPAREVTSRGPVKHDPTELFGAIRKMGGISSEYALSMTGESDPAKMKGIPRGVFQDGGQSPDEVTRALSEDYHFEIKPDDINRLTELIRQASADKKSPVVSMPRMEREAAENEEKAYRQQIYEAAAAFEVKTVGVKFTKIEEEVRKLQANKIQADEDRLAAEEEAVYDKVLAVAYQELGDDAVQNELEALATQYSDASARVYQAAAVTHFEGLINAAQLAQSTPKSAEGKAGIPAEPGGKTPGDGGNIETPGFALSAETPQDVRAREEKLKAAHALEVAQAAAARREDRSKQNKADKERRAAEVLKEREAAKKKEVDAAAQNFALGQEAPAPVVKKVTTEEGIGQGDLLAAKPDPVIEAKKTLDAAGITGTDRTTTIAAVRRGDLTAEDVAEAHPVAQTPRQIYDAALETFRLASQKFTAFRDDYRAQRTDEPMRITDAEFLAAKAEFDKAGEIADAAEVKFIETKNTKPVAEQPAQGRYAVKPPSKLYRGIATGLQEDGRDGVGTFMLGRGLYSSPDKTFAKKYGDVVDVPIATAWPNNPLVLRNVAGGAPSAFMDWALNESGLRTAREFNKAYPDPGEFVRSRGYDGVIAGDEIVKYPQPAQEGLINTAIPDQIGEKLGGSRKDKGIALESRSDDQNIEPQGTETPSSIRNRLYQQLGKSVIQRLEKNGLIKILRDVYELPRGLTISNGASAVYFKGVAYLISNRISENPITGKLDIARLILHEIGEHHGLEGMLGPEGYSALVKRVQLMRKLGNKRVIEAYDTVRALYTKRDPDTGNIIRDKSGKPIQEYAEDSPEFMHEILADIGQDADIQSKAWWKEVIAAVKRFLVRLGYTGLIKDGDIQDMVLHSLKTAAREDRIAAGKPVGSMMPDGYALESRIGDKIASAIPQPVKDKSSALIDSLVYNYVDRFTDLRKVQKMAGPVPESQDASLAEEGYTGKVRARTDDFHDDMLKPLVKAIHDEKLKYEEVEEYLHARHAPSRNAAMKEINPTAKELDAKRVDMTKTRDSLADSEAVQEYISKRRELRQAESDIEDGIADESLAEVLKADITKLQRDKDVRDYSNAVDQLKALKNAKPYEGDNTALSGMSNAKATEIIAKAKQDGKGEALEKISMQVDAITASTRQIIVESGLETPGMIKAWEDKYEHYVPLHVDEVQTGMPVVGQGFNIRGKESKRATGSETERTNILAHVMAQHEAAIVRSEKVHVDRTLFEFAKEHPDSNLWELDQADMVSDVDKVTGLAVRRVSPMYKQKPNVLTFKINGEEHTITFNEKNPEAMRMAAAFKNLSSTDLGEVTLMVGKFTRLLATMNTSANPVFVARNFMRDLQTAFVNLSDTELAGVKKQVFKDVPNAIRGFWNMARGEATSEWGKYAREFRDAGGQVGWLDHYKDIGARATNLKDMLSAMEPGKWNLTKREATAWWHLIEDANMAVENGVRLAAYVNARKQGMSEAKAAALAKNLTVNFNRHGAKGVELNMWYMFVNASIQGSARIIKAAGNKNVQKILGYVVASGFLMSLLARSLAGDDDDDGENDYDQLPEYVKDRNFVFWVGGRPVTIPMPYGYNFFATFGRKIEETMFRKNYSPARGAVDLASSFVNAFSPMSQGASLLQFAAPTIADPFIQWSENKNFAGTPLRKEQMPFGPAKPEYQMAFKSTSAPAKWLAELMNDWSGGNEVRPGAVNVNPAAFDFAVSSILGGGGRTYLQMVNIPIKAAKGDELQAREIPFANIFLSAKPENQVERKFFENLREVQTAADEFKTYHNDPEMLQKLNKDRGAERRLIGQAKFTAAMLENIRKRERALEKTKPEGWRETTKKLDERKRDLEARFNKRYIEATQ